MSERTASILSLIFIMACLFGGVYLDAGGFWMFALWVVGVVVYLLRPLDRFIRE